MFNQELHRRLDGEETKKLCVPLLSSDLQQLEALAEQRGWQWERAVREVLGAGIHTIRHLKPYSKDMAEMEQEERVRFLQDRWSSLEAAYSAMKFQAYQVMNQNDALEMNLRGLMPQLEAANERVAALEAEVRRLRALVPPADRQGKVLVQEPQGSEVEPDSWSQRVRRALTGHE